MESRNIPFTEQESQYLRIRQVFPAAMLFIFLVAIAGLIVYGVQDWQERGYIMVAIIIPVSLIAFVVGRSLLRTRKDLRQGTKRLTEGRVSRKSSRYVKHRRYFLTIGGQEYRVSKEAWDRFEEGDTIYIQSAPHSGIWLGFLRPDEIPSE